MSDQSGARTLAWAVESALMRSAPCRSDADWSGTVMPGLESGTVALAGTCTTTHGWSIAYSGSWKALGDPLTLGGPFSGQASIAIMRHGASYGWAAVLLANGQRWQCAP